MSSVVEKWQKAANWVLTPKIEGYIAQNKAPETFIDRFFEKKIQNTIAPEIITKWLHCAVSNLNEPVARILLPKTSLTDTTFLHLTVPEWSDSDDAVIAKKISMAQLLLANGADINKRASHMGFTPLHLACRNLQPKFTKFLLRNQADPNIVTEKGADTPLHLLQFDPGWYNMPSDQFFDMDSARTKIIKSLLKRGGDATLENAKKETFLDSTIKHKQLHELKYILAASRRQKVIDFINYKYKFVSARRSFEEDRVYDYSKIIEGNTEEVKIIARMHYIFQLLPRLPVRSLKDLATREDCFKPNTLS